MSSDDKVRDAFDFVTGTIRTISTMLVSADAVLADENWLPYKKWEWCWPTELPGDGLFTDPRLWFPRYFVRQYYRPDHARKEMLSIVAVPWEPFAPGFDRAACVVSYMGITTDFGDAHYWLGGVQVYHPDAKLDTVVRELDPSDPSFVTRGWEDENLAALRTIPAGKILSIARPLTTIESTATLKTTLLDPILARIPQDRPASHAS